MNVVSDANTGGLAVLFIAAIVAVLVIGRSVFGAAGHPKGRSKEDVEPEE